MNEIAFADEIEALIESARHDSPEMLAQVARSFTENTLITDVERFPGRVDPDSQMMDFTTRRGDVFTVTVVRIRAGVPA